MEYASWYFSPIKVTFEACDVGDVVYNSNCSFIVSELKVNEKNKPSEGPSELTGNVKEYVADENYVVSFGEEDFIDFYTTNDVQYKAIYFCQIIDIDNNRPRFELKYELWTT